MKRTYEFIWYPTKDSKYGKPTPRKNIIVLSSPVGKTEFDAKTAVNLFTSRFGNLHKNTIVKIKEFGEKGQIGEDIIPSEDSVIVPINKNKEK